MLSSSMSDVYPESGNGEIDTLGCVDVGWWMEDVVEIVYGADDGWYD